MKHDRKFALALLGASALALGACESYFKAHEDFRYYSAETAKVHADTAAFRRGERPPVDEGFRLHLSNFDTFLCDGARQFVANFDPEERTVSVALNGRNKFLSRTDSYHPFTDNIYALFVMEDGSLLVQKDGGTIFQHCRPLVADSLKSQVYHSPMGGSGGSTGPTVPIPRYEYTPTISPTEYNRGDERFDRAMSK